MTYQEGDRVRLIGHNDPHSPLRPGTEGTVRRYRENSLGQTLSVNWDDGSTLSMLLDEGDQVEKVS